MKPYDKTIQKYSTYNIDWLIGTVCNYKCSYCSPELHNGDYKFVDLNKAKLFLKRLVDKYEDKRFTLIISGGEPTVWPKLPQFIKAAKEHKMEVQLITNGSKPVQWWVDNAENINFIVISFHWEFGDPNHIENVCKALRDRFKSHIKVNILLTIEEFEKSYELAERLERIPGIIIELRPVRKNHGIYLIDYTDEQLERLKEKNRFGGFTEEIESQEVYTDQGELINSNDLILKKENTWKEWRCYIGLESMKVSYDGTIKRGNCHAGGIVGNINDEFELPDEPVVCSNDYCKCPTDIRATKERI